MRSNDSWSERIPAGIVPRSAIKESLDELGERLRQVEQPILKERWRLADIGAP